MISSTLGAPLGGTTVGGQHGLESGGAEVDHAAELRRRGREISSRQWSWWRWENRASPVVWLGAGEARDRQQKEQAGEMANPREP